MDRRLGRLRAFVAPDAVVHPAVGMVRIGELPAFRALRRIVLPVSGQLIGYAVRAIRRPRFVRKLAIVHAPAAHAAHSAAGHPAGGRGGVGEGRAVLEIVERAQHQRGLRVHIIQTAKQRNNGTSHPKNPG